MGTPVTTMDQIMDQEKKDMFFISFEHPGNGGGGCQPETKQAHLDWFDSHGVAYKEAAYRGYPESGPWCYAVYFDDHTDPRVLEYSAVFENEKGRSSDPAQYQMLYWAYEDWKGSGGEDHIGSVEIP